MTAMFNLIPELPPVISTADNPDLTVVQLKAPESAAGGRPVVQSPKVEPLKDILKDVKSSHVDAGTFLEPPPPVAADENSATEESDGDDDAMKDLLTQHLSQPPLTKPGSKPPSMAGPAPSSRLSSMPPVKEKSGSESETSSAMPPAKKLKKPVVSSTDDDSDEEKASRGASSRGGAGGGKRGTRQPIKRGNKRF
ncbi:hypothetical protein H0H92_007491 [Tricholoma furcatifolium]|nr:hypothetical protein H0H92_007491 [Tricholoma furcatifolium]